jgi:pectinesterase
MKSSRYLPLFVLPALSTSAGACSSSNAAVPVLDSGAMGAHDGSLDSTVSPDSGDDGPALGTHTTVQAAIDAAVAQGGTARIYIRVLPGTYREVVCIPTTAPPITLYSTNSDASKTVITFGNYNGEAKSAGSPANACTQNANAVTFGTAGSASFSAFANGFQAKNITIANDVTPATLTADAGNGTQAVALMTEGDQIILENVRVLGHQDTLYVETPNSDTVVRAYIKNSYVEGDVDFIFGGATFVLDGTQVQFVSDRRAKGNALSPSTDSRNPYGILAINGSFGADANTMAGAIGLGRAWDRSCGANSSTYLSTCVAAGHFPNGQAVVRNSTLDAHIGMTAWAPSATTARPFCNTDWVCVPAADGGAPDASGTCPANRLYEYQNMGPGAAAAGDAGDAAAGTCTDPRPQLTDTQATADTIAKYLAQAGNLTTALTTDNWDPTGGVGDVSTFNPTYTVAPH